jgi:hypothetical protein
VNNPLRRHDALGQPVALAAMIEEMELAPLQGRAREHLEPFAGRSGSDTEHTHSACGLA